jgi:hypothetical protein
MTDDAREPPGRAPDCLKCVHFRVTWNAAFPRSCALFGFKCRGLPSLEVLRSTGVQCPSFALKEGLA